MALTEDRLFSTALNRMHDVIRAKEYWLASDAAGEIEDRDEWARRAAEAREWLVAHGYQSLAQMVGADVDLPTAAKAYREITEFERQYYVDGTSTRQREPWEYYRDPAAVRKQPAWSLSPSVITPADWWSDMPSGSPPQPDGGGYTGGGWLQKAGEAVSNVGGWVGETIYEAGAGTAAATRLLIAAVQPVLWIVGLSLVARMLRVNLRLGGGKR